MDGDAIPQHVAQLQTQQLLDKIDRLEHENLTLTEKIKELYTYKSQIMAIHATDQENTHMAMQSDYKKLRDNIQKWIEACEKDENREKFTTHFEDIITNKAWELGDLGICQLKEGDVDSRGMEILIWLSQQETCNCVVLTRVIWGILEREIFQRNLLVGFHHRRMAHLQGIHREMVKQYDNTEVSQNRAGQWWTTAIRTVISAEGFKNDCEEATGKLLEHLIDDLDLWITTSVLKKHKNSLRTNVIELAIKLSRNICCSQVELYFRGPKDVFFSSKQTEPPGEPMIWKLLNIANWMQLRQEDVEGCFCCLFPGLYIHGVEEPLFGPLIVACKRPQQHYRGTRGQHPRKSLEITARRIS